MIWVGIGLIIIGLGLFALVGILIKPLKKVSTVLDDVQETTKGLPEKVDGILMQVKEVLTDVRGTLGDVNSKLKQLNPLFFIIGDLGQSTRALSSKMTETVEEYKDVEPESMVKRNNLEGLYGLVTLGVMGFQKGKKMQEHRHVVDEQ